MAAGLSKRQRTDHTRRYLQRIAYENGGEYVRASPTTNPYATGDSDGLAWEVRLGWGNMSNGESVGSVSFAVWPVGTPSEHAKYYSGWKVNGLKEALERFKNGE